MGIFSRCRQQCSARRRKQSSRNSIHMAGLLHFNEMSAVKMLFSTAKRRRAFERAKRQCTSRYLSPIPQQHSALQPLNGSQKSIVTARERSELPDFAQNDCACLPHSRETQHRHADCDTEITRYEKHRVLFLRRRFPRIDGSWKAKEKLVRGHTHAAHAQTQARSAVPLYWNQKKSKRQHWVRHSPRFCRSLLC